MHRQAGRSRPAKDNRLFVEAVLWIARTGSPWRDLPPSLGHWNSVFTRFRDWVKADVFKRLFGAVSDDPDMEYAMHRSRDRAQKGDFAPGHRPFQRRHDTKILALTDALGNLVRFELLPGHRFDPIGVPIIADLDARGAKVVISSIRAAAHRSPSTWRWRCTNGVT